MATNKRNGKPDGKPNRKLNKVLKIAPERPEARDEGPRLIPLEERPNPQQFGRRALELADIALGLRDPQSKRHSKRKD